VAGELRHGYRVVAQLGRWTLTKGRVEAQPVSVNAFELEQASSVSLRLTMSNKYWVWTDVEVVNQGTPLVVRVNGAPTVRDAQ